MKPSIELVIDEMNESKPTACSPYVWIVLMSERSGCAVDCDYYTPEEAPEKLREFLNDVGFSVTRTTYEAVYCRLNDIEGDNAVDAISMALLRYFESDDCLVENTFYDAPYDVEIIIKTAWNNQTDRFILHADSSISFPE